MTDSPDFGLKGLMGLSGLPDSLLGGLNLNEMAGEEMKEAEQCELDMEDMNMDMEDEAAAARAENPNSKRKRANRSALNDLMGADADEIAGLIKKRTAPRKRRKKRKSQTLTPALSKLLDEATECYIDGKLEQAVGLLLDIIKQAPKAPAPYRTLGTIYESAGETKKALEAFMIAATLTPKDLNQWQEIAKMARENGNLRQTVYCLDRTIRLNPEDVVARFERAMAYAQLGSYPKALEGLKLVLQDCPQNPKVLKELAEVYHRSGQTAQAVGLLEAYIDAFREGKRPKRRNVSRDAAGKKGEAQHEPLDLNLVNVLCELYLLQQQHQLLINTIKFLDSLPLSLRSSEGAEGAGGAEAAQLPIDLTVKYGLAHLHLGRKDQAEVLFSCLYDLPVEEYGDLYFDVAEAYVACNVLDRALDIYDTLSGPNFDQSALWIRQAGCLRQVGQTKNDLLRCISLYERVLEAEPDHVDARIALAELYREVGDEDRAMTLIKKKNKKKKKKKKRPEMVLQQPGGSDLAVSSAEELKVLVANANLLYNTNKDLEKFLAECLPPIQASIAAADVLVERSEEEEEEEEDADRVKDLIKLRRRKKSKGKGRATVAHPAKKLLGTPAFIELILKACKALSYLRRSKEAADLVLQIEGWGAGSKSSVQLQQPEAVEVMDEVKVMAAGITYNAGDYDMAYKFIRYVVSQRPHSFTDVHLLNRIINKLAFHSKCVRFVERLLDKHPDSVPLRILTGHAFLMHQNYDYALDQYGRVYSDPRYTYNPTVNMFMGIASVQKAMLRRTSDRHHGLMRAFAFFHHYYRLRRGDAEASYNLARAYHFLGLVSYAIKYYQEVLHRANQGDGALKCEAAHNLAVIYVQSGSHELARQLYREYSTV